MTEHYPADLATLRFHTPPRATVPALLEELYALSADLPWGTLGWFRLEGDRLDDFWLEDGSRVADAFVTFLRCADGGRVGFFRPTGEDLGAAEVVLLGSGEVRVLGRDLGGFLYRLAENTTGVDDLHARDEGTDDTEARARLLALLEAHCVGRSPDPEPGATEALAAWVRRVGAEARRRSATEKVRTHLAALLAAEIGLPDAAWRSTEATVQCAGSRFAFFWEGAPFEVGPELEAAVRALREDDARALPGAGLWCEATLRLDARGVLRVLRPYLDRPRRPGTVVDDHGLRIDHARAPRSAYWLPPWLAAVIDPLRP